jgi:hypothetical protein
MMPRADLLTLLRTALSVGSLRFARQAALSWLAYFPGDLPVNLLYGRALLQAGRFGQALPLLENVVLADPEDLEAQELRFRALKSLVSGQGPSSPDIARQAADCRAAIHALGGQPDSGIPLPVWAEGLRQARLALENGDLETAESLVHQALLVDSPPPLVAVTHLKVAAARRQPGRAMQDLSGFYHLRFPECLAPALLLAGALIESGDPEKAVELLHRAAASDITGQVAIRLWGPRHPYRELWPAPLDAPLELAVPADVAAPLGWNRLAPPRRADVSTSSPDTPQSKPFVVGASAPERTEVRATSPDAPQSDRFVAGASAPERAEVRATSPAAPEPDRFVAGALAPERTANPAGVDSSALKPESAPKSTAAAATGSGLPFGVEPLTGRRAPAINPPLPESLRSVQVELERVAAGLKRNHLARADGRFPVYVIFTTRQGLKQQYGAQILASLELEMKRLAAAVAAQRDWGAILVYADDPGSMAAFDLQAAQPGDPWSLKLALADLDAALARQGEMIGALLIVGGPEVVPFHHLPNPVDDADSDVPSDNPYASRDENYFIPEWPVGRLPGGAQASAQPLLQALRRMTERHTRTAQSHPWYRRWWRGLSHRFWPRPRRQRPSWGFTAAVWQRASLSVFRPIGEPQAMLVSPPSQVNAHPGLPRRDSPLPSARLGYFNLHGLQDASEWYGQRDPAEPAAGPDYPVAFSPQDVIDGGHAPQFVFSEACYGAYIRNKDIEEALALKFLAAGTQVVAGSTCTAYGSITTPLIAADLLGHAFWKFTREGLPAGEALRRAKIHLAREMHRRQGYLDGEDQKTLIAFVLYGDPLAQVSEIAPRAKAIFRPLKPPAAIKTVCDRAASPLAGDKPPAPPIPPETLAHVKLVVAQYLPGMADAQLTLSHEQSGCRGEGHNCPTSRFGLKSQPDQPPDRSVVILSKHVAEEPQPAQPSNAGPLRVHHHYARLTLDGQGKLVKLAVSR